VSDEKPSIWSAIFAISSVAAIPFLLIFWAGVFIFKGLHILHDYLFFKRAFEPPLEPPRPQLESKTFAKSVITFFNQTKQSH
jgi:hypothetical protein